MSAKCGAANCEDADEDFRSSATFVVCDRWTMSREKVTMATNRRASVFAHPQTAPSLPKSALQRRQSVDRMNLPQLNSPTPAVRNRVLSTESKYPTNTSKLVAENDRLRGENQRLQEDIRILRSNQKLLQDRLNTTCKAVNKFEERFQKLESMPQRSARGSPVDVDIDAVVVRLLEKLPKSADFAAIVKKLTGKKNTPASSDSFMLLDENFTLEKSVVLPPELQGRNRTVNKPKKVQFSAVRDESQVFLSADDMEDADDEKEAEMTNGNRLQNPPTSTANHFDLSDFRSPSPLKSSTMKEADEYESGDGQEDNLNATYTISSSDENPSGISSHFSSTSKQQRAKMDRNSKIPTNRRRSVMPRVVDEIQSYTDH